MKLAYLALAAVAAMASNSAVAENCTSTTFTALASIDCRGSFTGNLNGSASELTYLDAQFGAIFFYDGKSDDAGNGPFTSNPTVSTLGTLTFDSAIQGEFVIGIKAATQYSYYLFNALTPTTSLTFNSTAGIAVNQRGIPQDLSHAALYRVTAPVPEPETYALMLAGLSVVGALARRRRKVA